jgi:hypothetical protein
VNTLLPVALLSAALLTGCIAEQNDRMTLGRSVQLEGFFPPAATEPPEGVPVLADQPPTLTSIIRSDWEPTVIFVPVDGTAHHPTYAEHLRLANSSTRQRREYPTPTSALELTEGSEQDQAWEAAGNFGLTVLDLVLLLPRLIVEPAWRVRWSPDVAHARYWHPEGPQAVIEAPAPEPTP